MDEAKGSSPGGGINRRRPEEEQRLQAQDVIEIVENQRWYTLSGWSHALLDTDPPVWSDATRSYALDKLRFPGYRFEFFKGEDYDDEGWIYGGRFSDNLGVKTFQSCVRSRVWIGKRKPEWGSGVNAKLAEMKEEMQKNAVEKKVNEAKDETVDKKVSSGYISIISSAAYGLSKSAVSLAASTSVTAASFAAETSRKAASSTLKSVQEVTVYAFDKTHSAARTAMTSTDTHPRTSPGNKKESVDPFDRLSAMSKRVPHLTPFERSLISCCQGESTNKFLAPPEPMKSHFCKACREEFGISLFRYHCGYCSEAFCRAHLPQSRVIWAYGHTHLSKICDSCNDCLKQKEICNQDEWRVERVKDFLNDELLPYYSLETDTTLHKAVRAAEGTLAAAKMAPVGVTARMTLSGLDFLRKYGRAGILSFILRNEFAESFNSLKALLGEMRAIPFQDAAIGLYYMMAMNRGLRGSNPLEEKEAHRGYRPVSESLLKSILRFAPLALHVIYHLDVLDVQRLGKLQEFHLIFAMMDSLNISQPAFALFGCKDKKTAVLCVRGSKSVHDIITDLRAMPTAVEKSDASADASNFDHFAHDGILKAAAWIKDKAFTSLKKLAEAQYDIVVCGHSLGGGCAAILTTMLHPEFSGIKCYTFAVPACANYAMAKNSHDYVYSIVLRDDVVPHIKTHNIIKLVDEIEASKDQWRNFAAEDWNAFLDRAKDIWTPRKREWAQEKANNDRGTVIKLDQINEKEISEELAVKDSSDSHWIVNRENLLDHYDGAMPLRAEEKIDSRLKSPKRAESQPSQDRLDKELFIPGNLVHIYHVQGQYEAVHVDSDYAPFNRIPVHFNMLDDHLGKSYLAALRIVKGARKAISQPPSWVPFGSRYRCMCCESPFTWNSTSSSEAQHNKDQHNCRKCGHLVCEGCSTKRKPIPDFGINEPARVCDRCFYELDG